MHSPNRRTFVKTVATTAAALSVPSVATARRTDPTDIIIGKGDYQYRVNHQVLDLPDKYHWNFTHNVAVDSSNNVYVIHEGHIKRKDHPAIFVFDSDGKFIRAFGGQFQGGGHGLEVRKEGKEDFIYATGYHEVKSFAKMTTTGEIVWYKKAPMESGVYAKGEDISTKRSWNRKGFLPTNIAFLDDGGFLLADGYGSYFIHQFDKNAQWVKCIGGPGEGKGTFDLSHGLWVDRRPGRPEHSLLVTDRNRNSVQRLTLDGKHIETLNDLEKPCNIDTWENQMVIPEYNAAVSLLDEDDNLLVRFDEGVSRSKEIKNLRAQPKRWKNGHFMAPHDACFDSEGNIFVAERIPTGRITKLTRVS